MRKNEMQHAERDAKHDHAERDRAENGMPNVIMRKTRVSEESESSGDKITRKARYKLAKVHPRRFITIPPAVKIRLRLEGVF